MLGENEKTNDLQAVTAAQGPEPASKEPEISDTSTKPSSNGATPNAEGEQALALLTESEVITPAMRQEEAAMQTEGAKAEEEPTDDVRLVQERLQSEGKQRMRRHIQALIGKTAVYSNWIGEKLKDHRAEHRKKRGAAAKKDLAEVDATKVEIPEDDEPAGKVMKRKSARLSTTQEEVVEEKSAKKRKAANADEEKKVWSWTEEDGLREFILTETPHFQTPKRSKKASEVQIEYAPMEGQREGRQPRLVTGGTMREYQLVGMEWLISLYDNGLNGILADEMGLGKTLQCIAFLAHLYEMGTRGPFLIVAPLSTLANWVSEVERFTPDIPVLLYHGSKPEREHLRNHRMKVGRDFPIVVTSYEICMNDRNYLQNYAWKFIIVDEGHRLKNLNCRLVRELKSYPSANRLLLTGTPLQNNLSELWSLLNFIMPDIFDDLNAFSEWFEFSEKVDDLNDQDARSKLLDRASRTSFVTELHHILKPFLLRRTKEAVEIELPKKREYIIYAPLVPKQRALYEAAMKGRLREHIVECLAEGFAMKETSVMPEAKMAIEANVSSEGLSSDRRTTKRNIVRRNYKELDDTEDSVQESSSVQQIRPTSAVALMEQRMKAAQKSAGNQNLQHLIAQLRKICNHPFLFDLGTDDDLEAELPASHLPDNLLQAPGKRELPSIVSYSGKMLVLERMLPALFERGHKVLLFSQMTRVLDIVSDWCQFVKGWKVCRLDGGVKIDERRRQIQEFNSDPETKLFLLSTRAGGLGINLTAADTVIIFDSDWNPQADLQAQDRVHRIGQTKPVIIYRLVTANTVESKILGKAGAKRKLEKLVIHKNHFKGGKDYYTQKSATIKLEDLAALLESDEAEKIESGDGDADAYLPERILTDEHLARIMGRSDEAYERGGKGETADRYSVVEEVEEGEGEGVKGLDGGDGEMNLGDS
ncbi:hypothetical protein HK104_010510 [Borealophlyctis nickersoniae]|nr:hypothetical protein HK104_010510 [Borealophlyctis nickersoniae]